jgi:integrase
MILTAIASGLRIGELLAMKWANLDWHSGTYHVQETLTRKRDTQEAGLADVKTESSAQPVDLTPACLDALRDHLQRQKEIRLKRGKDYQDMGLVFALDSGKPMNDGNVMNRIFHPALDDAELRRINFHGLRHTCASLLIAQGENPKYVQKQMRHASVQITFDTYGHLMPGTGQDAARRLDETIFGKRLKAAKSA